MPPRRTRITEAIAESVQLAQAKAALESPVRRGAGSQDPLIGDLRKGGLLPLLVLHFVGGGPSYGNQLMERVEVLTRGAVTVNPNTMYPLLRQLEAQGLIAGEWEHPERRSRRYYTITPEGQAERGRLAGEVGPRLERIAGSIEAIRAELGS